ncbi:mechanosensitive ion channel family protein, partial [Vibrio parahaemolyticus]|nr:mechanosensitive ion channel family protein [Vibrio parahaemolyticus]MDG2683422.1 mechanosensitive ion channel family protein [Vibrio parahaemolyticus]
DSMQGIKEALDENGIEIPFPQMDVHLNRVES